MLRNRGRHLLPPSGAAPARELGSVSCSVIALGRRQTDQSSPRSPRERRTALSQHTKPEGIAVSRDIAPYLACIESAAKIHEPTKSHAREMEAVVDDLRQRQIDSETSLNEAKYRNRQLQESFVGERNRAAQVQMVASHAANRIQELEAALAEANARADALTSAIEKAFADVVNKPNSRTAAAA